MPIITIAIVLAIIVIVAMLVSIYNSLVALKNQTDRAWANVEVILKQRFDEIPQLVEVIEQSANYEQKTLQKVIEARNNYGKAQTVDSKIQASNEMSVALKSLVALGEAYPDLKATQSFQQLQSRVSELEGAIADRRELFNETITNYNTRIAQIPDTFFAGMLGYKEKNMYRPPESEMTRPSLKMNLN